MMKAEKIKEGKVQIAEIALEVAVLAAIVISLSLDSITFDLS